MLSSSPGWLGLDPAGPRFDNFDEDAKLDRSDAQFVDVIHTNGQSLSVDGGFGLLKQSGHVDFYPNGGEKQPGCTDGLVGVAQSLLGSALLQACFSDYNFRSKLRSFYRNR